MDKNLLEFIKFVSDNKNNDDNYTETPKNSSFDALFENLTLFKESDTKIPISENNSFYEIPPIIESKTPVLSVKQIAKEQSNPVIQELLNRIKFLESQIANLSYSSGGGSGSIIDIDKPTKTVNTDYTINRKDYYVGVNNSNSSTNITLGNNSLFYGKTIIIKDESGNCSTNPISIIGMVDNDSNGVVLAIDNSSLTLIYTVTGWKII